MGNRHNYADAALLGECCDVCSVIFNHASQVLGECQQHSWDVEMIIAHSLLRVLERIFYTF